MRVFVAVELPNEVRRQIAAAGSGLLDGVRGAKPVREESLHVTVRFLGEVPESALPPILDAVRRAAATVPCTTARARGLGAFPDARRPSVLWAGLDDPDGALRSLEAAVSERLLPLGHAREERPFTPHVTFARLGGPRGRRGRRGPRGAPSELSERLAAASADPPEFGEVPVTEATVFQSEPGPGGSRYTALARLPLDPRRPMRAADAPPRSDLR